jgi:pimeloyl-ACP methyl ester carboxylesterase
MTTLRILPALVAGLVYISQSGCGQAAERQTFDANGVRLAYTVQGKGQPVVLLHGWLSSGGVNWDLPGTTRRLARDYQVVTLDLPAHGWSDKPTREEAYGPELVEDVVRLLDHLKIDKAHVVGYSMGGIITARLVATHPERVRSATLAGAGWLRAGGLEQRIFASGGKDGKPVGLCFRSLARLALTEDEVKAIRVPVVVLFGDRDGLKKLYADPLKAARKDWRVIEIRDADHLTCIFKPQFQEEIRTWLASQSGR